MKGNPAMSATLLAGAEDPPPHGFVRSARMQLVALLAGALLASPCAEAADTIRLAMQKTGTVAWEIATMKALGLDKAADLDIQTAELATPESGKIALQGGAADLIVSDWLWAARERTLGDKLLFAPYSTALGAVMAPKEQPIHALADLAGRSLGVAGGPLDKSWLLVQAAARKEGVDLARAARPAYGAPPLIAEKLASGELDAALEFWTFSVALEARGFRRAVDMAGVEKTLGATGPVAMTGYVFTEAFARDHGDALRRFLDAAARARQALASDPALWTPIKARLRLTDEAALDIYRKRYAEGVPKRSVAEEAQDAKALYRAIVAVGGPDLVGGAADLDTGLFYDANAAR
ncbi:NitT/TauT family transport system substrate-binding protein [Roseiarcus fermentans]|uniref:NitT/TauT family transport system substrate-binding protein n=1 Tax=Roseiarcus fermentans TaxID=1473586 RepID=A0A366FFP3_9HYPH|nr:ABC transporter substrate-binding protein [Roseiarcus fermentans]RBP12926.1 NitT/TauT family transport system substrate-binding protein [Roseiarcus fermentans]